jgi:hypothetical protein
MCVDAGHWLYRRCDARPRAHEWNNPLLHSRSHRQQVARAWPFSYVVVGDSLTGECPWKWAFGLSPVAVANLAAAGADLRRITRQVELARDFRPQIMLISGGINDLINMKRRWTQFDTTSVFCYVVSENSRNQLLL